MGEKPSVLLSLPWYICRPETAICLAQTYVQLAAEQPTYIALIQDCPSIGHARSRLVAQFMASPCTHMLMIDGDMAWSAQSVKRLLGHNVPFVGVSGPDKHTEKLFVGKQGAGHGEMVAFKYDVERGLLTVDRLGACFMLIRRDCIETMMAAYPELHLHAHEIQEEAPAVPLRLLRDQVARPAGCPPKISGSAICCVVLGYQCSPIRGSS